MLPWVQGRTPGSPGARAALGLCIFLSARSGEERAVAGSCVKPGTGYRGWDKDVHIDRPTSLHRINSSWGNTLTCH